MVRINLLFLLLFIAVTTHAQKRLAESALKGKVRSVLTDMEMLERKSDSTRHEITYREYNEQGNETVFISYYSQFTDSILGRTLYYYNENGRMVRDSFYGRGITSQRDFLYDSLGRLTEQQIQIDKEPPYRYFYTYQANGKLAEVKYTFPNGRIRTTDVYIYNGKYPVQVNTYDSLNRLQQICYYLDTATRQLAEEYYRVKNTDSLALYFTAVYNANGEWLMQQYFWKNGTTTYPKQLNNANETMVMTTTVTKGSKKTITTRRYQYTYDDKGNWITSVSKSKGRPDLTTTRTITYY